MRLSTLQIINFRTITNIETNFTRGCNVIVGPNAVGKTTLLDAIRLTKALLAPRTQNEANQILFALGAMSPHNAGLLDMSALANDPSSNVEIHCGVEFDLHELAVIELPQSLMAIAMQLMMSNMGRPFASQTELVGMFSSHGGALELQQHNQKIVQRLQEIRTGTRKPVLGLSIDPKNGQLSSSDPEGAAMIAFLDRRLPPLKTIFSYFPADRAIPAQEQPVQIGPGDANNQLESHNSQPQLKYSRLKNTIFNAVLAGKTEEQSEQFSKIFARILRGRTLSAVKVSEQARLLIEVRDDEKGRSFSIDGMSSGEKGLILTCLLIVQTMQLGGIVLLDEPELHLNPAVCRDVLNFLAEEYAGPLSLQMIICSHSPEILSIAFDREDCELYHLVAGNELASIRKQDMEEVGTALKKLGTSQSEGLLYHGTVFVEGEDDSDILQEGFKRTFLRYSFRELGGRKNIEKEIQILQTEARQGRNRLKTAFILDNDNNPTSLKSVKNVGVLQWDRRCLENYLLDFDILTDIAKDHNLASKIITNTTAVRNKLKELAMKQVHDMAFWNQYHAISADTPLKPREIHNKNYGELATLVAARIAEVNRRCSASPEENWEARFDRSCREKETELKSAWEHDWPKLCDGKTLIRNFHEEIGFKESLTRFKIRIIKGMEATRTDLYKEIEGKLNHLLQEPTR